MTSRGRSLWADTVDRPVASRPSLPGGRHADVAIVGAGYTGLWTAYHLAESDATLRIVVVDRADVGFGASGRNGGWCVGELAGLPRAGRHGVTADGRRRLARAAADEVARIGQIIEREAIGCDWAHGGSVRLARNPAQLARLEAEHDELNRMGLGDQVERLGAREARQRVGATDVLAGLLFAPTAALHPLKLALGLADAVERRGVTIHGGTTALLIGPGRVDTDHGRITAPIVIRATEGYTPSLAGHRRTVAPLSSSMIATAPLGADVWDQIGLARRETFADNRHLVIYGQRTADGRIAFGSRGAPYRYKSAIHPADEARTELGDFIRDRLIGLFPQLTDVEITHQWAGVLGVPRDWVPSVGLDRRLGMGWAGGYVGEGVAAAALAGRTLAALVTGESSDLTDLPWVDHRSRRWEPEPLRWLGINGALGSMRAADRTEQRTGRPSRRADLMWRFLAR